MKKFNVKLLSMAVAAAVVSSAAGATEADIKKDVDVLKLKTTELNQIVNGFAAGEDFVETNKTDGSKTIRKATDADVEADDLDGKGLVEAVFHVSQGLQEVSDTVDEVKRDLSIHEEAIKDNTAAINATITEVANISKEVVDHRDSLSAVNTRVDNLAQETAEALDEQNETIKKLEDAITTNGTRIAEVATGVNELNKSVADMDKNFSDQFGEIGEDVTAVNTRVDSLAQDTADAKAAAESAAKAAADTALMAAENAQALNGFAEGDEIVVTDKNGIKSIKTATKEDVENADFEGVGLKEIVEVHDKALDDLAKSVTVNNDALATTAAVVNDISADVNANKAALEEQKEANEGFNNAIASLDEDISTLKKVGLAAADALEVNRQDIDANKAAIAENTAAIDKKADKTDIETAKKAAVEAEKSAKSVQGSVEVAQKSAETAEGYAKAAQTSADAANNVASAAQTAAAQAQDAVKANAAQVAVNKADIATLQTASSQHAAGIAKNSARIDSLDKNVANLRKETRQGLAAQAALSGLFQPYSVGKFNVTAALGGFKSDTAVAVGAGYRFNENFAAKAGLAVGTSSGGSASYNVGVNYEW